jgi:hypothetical protein
VTTARFNQLAGATARATEMAYNLAVAGTRTGSFQCPKCRGTVRFSALVAPHKSAGSCTTTGCVRWAVQ